MGKEEEGEEKKNLEGRAPSSLREIIPLRFALLCFALPCFAS